jgi:hypothetical protein
MKRSCCYLVTALTLVFVCWKNSALATPNRTSTNRSTVSMPVQTKKGVVQSSAEKVVHSQSLNRIILIDLSERELKIRSPLRPR